MTKEILVTFRVTEAEKTTLIERTKREGFKSVSPFIRCAIRSYDQKSVVLSRTDRQAVEELTLKVERLVGFLHVIVLENGPGSAEVLDNIDQKIVRSLQKVVHRLEQSTKPVGSKTNVTTSS